MPKCDFPSLLKMLTDQPIGGLYGPVYLAFGFLSAAMQDEDAREDLTKFCAYNPEQIERLRTLNSKLQEVIAAVEKAN